MNYRYILYTLDCEKHRSYDWKVGGYGAYYLVEIWEDDWAKPDDHIQNIDIGYYCSESCYNPYQYDKPNALVQAYYRITQR